MSESGFGRGGAASARVISELPGGRRVRSHARALPLRVGTRGSPLALVQTRAFLGMITNICPVLCAAKAFEEHAIATSGDLIQDRRLAEIGGKGLFAKEIHEALLDGRVDFAVHCMKDLETKLPPGLVLACCLPREDERDALVLGPRCGAPSVNDPYGALPHGALIGTSSVRRQSQLLAARPDLRVEMLRGNVQTRLRKVSDGTVDATLLAVAGLRRLGLEHLVDVALSPETMVPSAGQGIVGITVREEDVELCELLSAIEDPAARIVSLAERALLDALDGSCRTPVGSYAFIQADGQLRLTGLVATEDGSFCLRRVMVGRTSEAAHLGKELGESLKRDSPSNIFQP
ncbi:hydroxymethylbilane synthase [Elioraea sp.]|uniref:hydroxymethylbilane synthase n=1 Tax=Elioraea sp. TaxID=2185103 RepID=UPI0038CFCB14